MPELAEAETIRRQLEPLVAERVIASVSLSDERLRRQPTDPAGFAGAIVGRKVSRLLRRGKALILILDESMSLVIRLGMSGTLTLARQDDSADRHVHLRLGLVGGGEVRLRDPRRFGGIGLYKTAVIDELDEFAHYGPDALSDDFCAEYLAARVRGRRPQLGVLLMDQRLVAGIGKIYSDEICFRAGVRPTRRAGRLTRREVAGVVQAAREVLEEAIGDRGTSAGDRTYMDSYGLPGGFRPAVYLRTGQPCIVCGTPIRRTRLTGGRGLHWCPSCQK